MFLKSTIIVSAFESVKPYPKYDDVVKHFFETTTFDSLKDPDLSFQKKPDGWFVKLVSVEVDTLLKIWDFGQSRFLNNEIIIDSSKSHNELLKKYFDNWEKIHFDACPYFGYADWDKNVIDSFANYSGFDANIIYGIGRAYSNYANSLLINRSNVKELTERELVKNIGDKLNHEQLIIYRQYRHKAIDLFNKVTLINPNYQTLVGDISLKRDLEHMTSFLDLMMFSTELEALKEIPDNLFSPFLLEWGNNLLLSCDKNAIIFTNGDLDTYLPIYLQQKKGIRKDITIVNAGQLSLSRMTHYLKNHNEIKFSVNDAFSGNEILAYAFMKSDSTSHDWTSDEVFKIINDQSHRLENEDYTYTIIPTKRFSFKYNGKTITWNSEKKYLYKYQMIVFDIIVSNSEKHPIYFASTSGEDIFEGFDQNMIQQILVYKLVEDHQIIGEYYNNIDLDKSFELATRKFHWQHAGEGKKHEKLLSIGYRISLAKMANELAIEAKKDSAIKILDLCLKYFGNDKLAFDYFALKIMEACYKLKLYDKGNQIAKTIVYNFNHDITVLDDDVVRQKSPKYEKLVDDVRDLMNLYYQDVSIIEGSK